MHKNLEKNLPFLLEEFSHGEALTDERWRTILQRFFSDAILSESPKKITSCQFANHQQVLAIPPINDKHYGYILISSEEASAFNTKDLELAKSLHKLTRKFISIEDAFERGAAEERKRIARDLHDDVAARMLTLIHTVKDSQAIALSRSILKSLRNAIYTLDNKSTATILDAITDVRSEIQDRLNSIGMQLMWHQSDKLEGLTFTPRQHINLNRMLHEATTNIIRHADANFMEVIIDVDNYWLSVEVSDNGQGFEIENCIPGKGINNITTRAQEIQGTAGWFNLSDRTTGQNKGSCVRISFPLSK